MESVAWIDPEGEVTTFSRVELNLAGRFFPSLLIDDELVPGQVGSRLREIRHGPLEFSAAVWVSAATETALRTAVRQAVYALDPTRGTGTWRNTGPGGDQRDLRCVVTDGLGLAENESSSGRWAQRLALAFKAHDPYWEASSDTVEDFALGTAPSFLGNPFFPLRLTSSELLTETTVVNGGDVATWPVWTVTGPGSSIAIRNLTTGSEMVFTGLSLLAGEYLVIDARPGHKTVLRSDGQSLWPYLTLASALWPLGRGGNSIRIEMAGSTAASGVRLTYRTKYLTP